MEFPGLGEHCSLSSCNRLDFLPMKCDGCEKTFCNGHVTYNSHNCQGAYKKDVQVPVCPLCNKPVPVNRGEPPDIKVGQHIDQDCQSDPAKEKRKFNANKCSVKGCKKKELIPVRCDSCRKNYCLRHRHQQDHDCSTTKAPNRIQTTVPSSTSSGSRNTTSTTRGGPQQTSMSNLGRDLDRARRERSQRTTDAQQIRQPALSEDEALALAIKASLSDTPQNRDNDQTTSQEEEDRALAQALADSEIEARRNQRPQQAARQSDSKCTQS